MNFQCVIGFHKWITLGGPNRLDEVKFEQKYKCERCFKIKRVKS
jgi:hypothetical protein